MSSMYAAAVTQMAQAGLRRTRRQRRSRALPERLLPERMNQARYWACPESFHEEIEGHWSGADHVQNGGSIGKGY
jgi:hypothetical protein